MNHVQSYINNISFPKTLDELYMYATEHGCFNVEDILYDGITEWTVPFWTKNGDIVFFMHTKTAKSTITKLRTELLKKKSQYTCEDFELLLTWINHGLELYKCYGGKIFAIGRVISSPAYDSFEDNDIFHWSSRIYASIDIISILEHPLDISCFNDFIKVSRQSGITPVVGNEFSELRSRMAQLNSLPESIWECDATPLPLSKVNRSNWFTITGEYRRHFFLEIQFRHFYVDYLLREIGDQKTFYTECRCIKPHRADTFVDNVILFGGKYLPVEVKLSVSAQQDLPGQVAQYCENSEIVLDSKKDRRILPSQIHRDKVLIVDTDCLYMYDHSSRFIQPVFELDSLRDKSALEVIRNRILRYLE